MSFSPKLSERSIQFQEVIDACRYLLDNDPMADEARKYLDSRLSKEAQARYEFGYFPSDEDIGKLTSLVSERVLKSSGLMYPRYISGGMLPHGHFTDHNIIMPFRNPYGDIVSIVGRTSLSSEEQKNQGLQKYKYSLDANKRLYLYGMDKAKQAIIDSDFAICVEGQFDCIACHENGIKNVVACGGSYLMPFQLFQILRYTNNLVLLLDGDEAGLRARVKIKKRYGQYARIGAMTPPNKCKDIDEFFLTNTGESRNHVINVLKNLRQQILQ